MVRSVFLAARIPDAASPYDVLHLKVYYPASSGNSEAERMTGIIPSDRSHGPMPVVIFFSGINVGMDSYHWLAVRLAEANIVTVTFNHVAETLPGLVGLTPGIDLSRVTPDTYGSGATCPALQPILDELARLNDEESGPLYQALDPDHVILGGHSAGGTVALQNGRYFDQVRAVFSYAGHTMASTMLGFAPGTVLKIAGKRTMLLRGDRDGVIAASRARYGTDELSPDPVAKTFDEGYEPSSGSEAYDILIRGANHFAVAHPLDETSGRYFLDMELTRSAEEIRNQIAGLVLAFIKQIEINTEHCVVRKK